MHAYIYIQKVEGLPETAKPIISLQLSASTNGDDGKLAVGEMISFGGVDTSMAILTIDSVNDADIPLGTVPSGDESIEIAPLCVLDDPKNPKDEYITDVPIVIVAASASAAPASASAETETDKTDESATATTDNNDEVVVVTNTEPVICTVTLKVTYKPSAKDQREELYDLLNKTSQRKATALAELRKLSTTKAAAAASSSSTAVTKPSGVKSGFLNKGGANKKSTINDEENNNKGFVSKVKNWYGRFVTGPESIVMKTAFWGVVTKDFWIFFGAVGFFHFNGHVLALPPPV